MMMDKNDEFVIPTVIVEDGKPVRTNKMKVIHSIW